MKNQYLSKNLKLNIINEQSNSNITNKKIIRRISINSKLIKKNDVYFAIKGKRLDGNRFVHEALKKKSSLVIVNRINKNYPAINQIKVKDSLNFLTECSSIFRQNIDTKILSITGSCGKTTLKEMIGQILKKITKASYSPKSFNNKYGVPLSLFNLRQNDKFGIFEVGMDKKGEINDLTKIIEPDLGIITNISYAHSRNFKSINHIADAKAEIMNNIKNNGIIVLNKDDKFFHYHKKIALKKRLKIISFGIKNKTSMITLLKVKKIKSKYELFVRINGLNFSYYTNNKNINNLYNMLATLAAIYSFIDIKKIKKDIFLNFEIPEGRGDISEIKLNNKKIFLIDETYNSNPLSLKTAIENFDNISTNGSKKYLILGDMLELGKHSIAQHKLISNIINKTQINKVFVIGKFIKETFKKLRPEKKAQILRNKFNIIQLINKKLNNNDYLMIKGSNSTGLHNITHKLKKRSSNAI